MRSALSYYLNKQRGDINFVAAATLNTSEKESLFSKVLYRIIFFPYTRDHLSLSKPCPSPNKVL